jgi:hypothetical protein
MSVNQSVPNETQGSKQYDDYRVSPNNIYSAESDVYDVTGFTTNFLQTLGGINAGQTTSLVNGFIAKADERIRRWLGIPITIRKEGHEFFNNPVVQLGPDREDPFEMFGSYNPENKAVEVYAIYYNEYRTKIPYPKDWDMFTEPSAVPLWGVTGSQSTFASLIFYTPCVPTDVGLPVVINGATIGPLISYNNVTQTWVVGGITSITQLPNPATDTPPYLVISIFNGTGKASLSILPTIDTTTTLAADTVNFKCGIGSLHATVIDINGGSIIFPKNKNFNRRIYPWFYCGFYFMTDTPSANFQFRMVRNTGSYYYGNFVASSVGSSLAYTWVPIMLSIRRFQFANVYGEGAQPDFNWILTPTQYIEITADRPCQFWIDNFSFNDGFFATYPEGTISWCMPEWYPSGRISVTYSFDPYLVSVPPALLEASSKLAGVLLIDWAIGKRQMAIAFEELSDTLAESPDKVTLENTRRRLETEAYSALETLGYKSYEGIG